MSQFAVVHDDQSEVDRIDHTVPVLEALRRRLGGRYPIDPFGYDPQLVDLVTPVFTSALRVEITGGENLPKRGPAVLIANRGFGVAEPALLGIAVRRSVQRRLRIVGAPALTALGGVAAPSGRDQRERARPPRLPERRSSRRGSARTHVVAFGRGCPAAIADARHDARADHSGRGDARWSVRPRAPPVARAIRLLGDPSRSVRSCRPARRGPLRRSGARRGFRAPRPGTELARVLARGMRRSRHSRVLARMMRRSRHSRVLARMMRRSRHSEARTTSASDPRRVLARGMRRSRHSEARTTVETTIYGSS